METKIQLIKTETSPAISVAFLENKNSAKRPIIFGHGSGWEVGILRNTSCLIFLKKDMMYML